MATRRNDTVLPEAIADELKPTVTALGLVDNCRQLAEEGWTIVKDAADAEFVARLRNTILTSLTLDANGGNGSDFMLHRLVPPPDAQR